jgi:hypothetical protein
MASESAFSVIVGGKDQSLADARRRARPVLRNWLRKVECAVIDKKLQPLDYLMAKELVNYPSANEGYCYAGQTRLGRKLGRCDRTARESLKRLCDQGLLQCKRGGPGRTASWTFCLDKTPIFGNPPNDDPSKTISIQDRKTPAGLDRKDPSGKPF